MTPFARALLHDRSGVSALTVALMIIPILGFFGLAIDYGNVLAVRQQLNAAADAASLQAINTARAEILANPNQDSATTQTDAQAAGVRAFNANAGSAASAVTGSGPQVSLQITDPSTLTLTLTATAAYSASASTLLAQVFGTSSFSFSGSSQSSATMANYVGYYLLVDVSGSMGTPSTLNGQAALATLNTKDMHDSYPQGCLFACHFAGYVGYTMSRTASSNLYAPQVSGDYCPSPSQSNCIQLRIDAVTTALQAFTISAQEAENYPDQIAVGLYPFIVNVDQYYPTASSGSTLSTDLGTIASQAGCLPALLDNGGATNSKTASCPNSVSANVTMGAGGTHISNALNQLYGLIPRPIGDGSGESKRKPVVFLITDGAEDDQTYSYGNWYGSNHATIVTQSYCQQLTKAGVLLYILYIPYITIQPQYFNSSFANDEDGFANANIPYIPPSLQGCVTSQSNYFVADAYNPQSITDQIQAMFAQSLQATRLVK
ncbi:hypothetical protein GALL_277750 [mine drainage metagenome]|uniref:Putative Flp pilus-assembly TadG-like N-terminal domain-containing protein n=1 Tax=mine drainage metagenome TaxID=410659 RepID=A0A1J5RQH3_9ZZZZ